LERAEEKDKEVTGVNLSDAIGIERLVAFFARCPVIAIDTIPRVYSI
jgi:hypothetical protein